MNKLVVWTVEVRDNETSRMTRHVAFGASEQNARRHARLLKAQVEVGGTRTVELIKVTTTRTVEDLQ